MTTALRVKLQNISYTLQRISQRCEKQTTSLLFVTLATQFFVAIQVAQTGCCTRNFARNLFRNSVMLQVEEKNYLV